MSPCFDLEKEPLQEMLIVLMEQQQQKVIEGLEVMKRIQVSRCEVRRGKSSSAIELIVFNNHCSYHVCT
jgi:hypothetical protein